MQMQMLQNAKASSTFLPGLKGITQREWIWTVEGIASSSSSSSSSASSSSSLWIIQAKFVTLSMLSSIPADIFVLPLLLIINLTFFHPIACSSPSSPSGDLNELAIRQVLKLDPSNLDLFFFRAAVFALFKVKADALLVTMPPTERIIYQECQADANGRLNLLAKCLVALFNIRDYQVEKASKGFDGFGKPTIRREEEKEDEDKEEEAVTVEIPTWEWIFSGRAARGKAMPMRKEMRKPMEDQESEGRKNGKKNTKLDGEKEEERKVEKGIRREEEEEEAIKQIKPEEEEEMEKIKMDIRKGNLQRNFARYKKLIVEKEMEEEKVKKRRRKWKEIGRGTDGEANNNLIKRRRKREIHQRAPAASAEEKLHLYKKYPNVQKLLRIEQFYKLVEKCNEYIQRKDQQYSRFLQSANVGIRLSTGQFQRSPLLGQAESQLRGTVHFDQMSILSPKLLSLIPENIGATNSTRNASSQNRMMDLLSPTFLSFHEQGQFSLPYLLKLVFTNDARETLPWLDLLLEVSGAAKTLDQLLNVLEPKMAEISNKLHPAILALEQVEKRFNQLEGIMKRKEEKKKEKRNSGEWTFLNEKEAKAMGTEADNASLGDLSEEEMDAILEDDIRAIAQMPDQPKERLKRHRAKRFLSTQDLGQIRMLNPYYFANQINDSAILRRIVVSPRAFSAAILSADFFRMDVLSPAAFIATILSPRAAIAHILGPDAFAARILSPEALVAEVLNPKALDARILSPRALAAFVLSPRLLISEILSPKAFEVRVLTPSALNFIVLSPTIIGASVLSPKSYTLSVLSPNILTPGFLNQGTNNVEILSPQILGG